MLWKLWLIWLICSYIYICTLYLCSVRKRWSDNYGQFRGCDRNSHSSSAWVLVLATDTQYSAFTAGSTCPHVEKHKLHYKVFFLMWNSWIYKPFSYPLCFMAVFSNVHQQHRSSLIRRTGSRWSSTVYHFKWNQGQRWTEADGRDRCVKMLNVYITPAVSYAQASPPI